MDDNVDNLNFIKQLHHLLKVPCNMLLFNLYIKTCFFSINN